MRNKQNNELAVCGFSAVKKLEKLHGDKIRRLYFTEETAPLFGGLCKKLAARKGIYNKVKDSVELEKLSGTVHHQGVVAMIYMPEIIPLDSDITDEWIENGENAILLDHIGNANNFGAIVKFKTIKTHNKTGNHTFRIFLLRASDSLLFSILIFNC